MQTRLRTNLKGQGVFIPLTPIDKKYLPRYIYYGKDGIEGKAYNFDQLDKNNRPKKSTTLNLLEETTNINLEDSLEEKGFTDLQDISLH